ncbi:lytic murein transglycosylase B [Acinetobacter baylyi]|uniref:Membrane-bound lytic murein transglycosylase B n=1 Tax=Acinetobacter baylyi (strain ATCC 33305 / BD413 / ADP1) TaxID=62977 RepID=Q6FA58_ACIAD|nr:lytic murein transglycosylase B [Acinetobacter baylyi]ENV53991.1 lytic murein transglycosylase B [Acinetobacter baylyi DSM 14961 = CIP 107474]KAF2372913.1 lytic murein transglycosylase B [Acinetobacter baylyi]KAF2375492.1 lytic murein transglycosylase B [Acinetobacter baylyi]KAF2377091.1 lytic murein transglycosylase B [Acinetobacter baylyi]KAF2382921.1 lytic murein transglycosylase B [Acinetobacter baylyi]
MLNLVLNKPFKQLLIMSSLFITASCSQANDFITDPNYQSFKQKTMNTYGLTSDQIDNAMSGAKNLPNILSIMTRPGESKPWYDYKAMFLAEGTIQRGVRFKNQYADVLNRAEQQFGVPQSIILGILGVETGYGANKGSFITRDALATLAFGYPRRADYFSDELGALIAWTYKEGYPTNSIVGSYAGAIGYPQFMPSNITKFGVDYDGSGHIDLRNSAEDAIASIANYLAQNGWQRNQPVGFPARYSGNTPDAVIAKDLTQPTPYGVLKSQGVTPLNPVVKIDDLDLVNVIQLQENYGPMYYITYPNFQVITTYNRSRMYATAVWLLGTEVASR